MKDDGHDHDHDHCMFIMGTSVSSAVSLNCSTSHGISSQKSVTFNLLFFPVCSSSAEQSDYAYSTSQLTRLLSKNPQWSRIRDTERERLGLTLDHDREFW